MYERAGEGGLTTSLIVINIFKFRIKINTFFDLDFEGQLD